MYAYVILALAKGLSRSNEDDCATHYFQHLHDFRLVWTSQVPGRAALQSNRRELDDRVL